MENKKPVTGSWGFWVGLQNKQHTYSWTAHIICNILITQIDNIIYITYQYIIH